MTPEANLLQRARRFEQRALAEIYDTYSPELYRYAMRLLGDVNLAEDCVAETFTRFLRALRERRGPREHLQAYLYRVSHNWIVDLYRRQPSVVELDERHPSEAQPPEESTFHRLRQAHLRSALRQLTPDQQQVITLKYLQGWDHSAIAQALGKPVGAIKSLQHRALSSLKRLLLSEDFE